MHTKFEVMWSVLWVFLQSLGVTGAEVELDQMREHCIGVWSGQETSQAWYVGCGGVDKVFPSSPDEMDRGEAFVYFRRQGDRASVPEWAQKCQQRLDGALASE